MSGPSLETSFPRIYADFADVSSGLNSSYVPMFPRLSACIRGIEVLESGKADA